MKTRLASLAILSVLAVAAFASCTTSYDTVDLDGKTKGYHIYCGGMPYAPNSDCNSRAEYICGDGGYTVLTENDPSYSHTQSMWDLTTHDMLVKCNVPTPATPAPTLPVTK